MRNVLVDTALFFWKVLETMRGDSVLYDPADLLYRLSYNGGSNQEEGYQITQVGLRLPNGDVIWPPDEYKGYPVDTPGQRAILLEVLRKSAGDLCFSEDGFLQHYKWVQRTLSITVKTEGSEELPITHSMAFTDDITTSSAPTSDSTDDERERDHENVDTRTVYKGSVGSTA